LVYFVIKAQPQFKTFIRKVLVRNPDGTTKIISETVTQPIASQSPAASSTLKPEQPQKIQVMKGADGKLSVRGLHPNQKLVQTTDGKYLILPSNSNGIFIIIKDFIFLHYFVGKSCN
jgi:nucleosome-remodeling factor subunit BPTF